MISLFFSSLFLPGVKPEQKSNVTDRFGTFVEEMLEGKFDIQKMDLQRKEQFAMHGGFVSSAVTSSNFNSSNGNNFKLFGTNKGDHSP